MTDEERIIELNRRTQQLKSIVISLLDEYPKAALHGRLKVWEEGVSMIIKYFAEHSGIEPLVKRDASDAAQHTSGESK